MDRKELIKWTLKCADSTMNAMECEHCPYNGNGCNDEMLRDLAHELEMSISSVDFSTALNTLKRNGVSRNATEEASEIYKEIKTAISVRDSRQEMLSRHKEYYLMIDGKIRYAGQLITGYEIATSQVASDFSVVRNHYEANIICEIPANKVNAMEDLLK